MHVCINTNITNVSIGPEFGNMRYMHSTPHMTFFTPVPNLVVVQEKMETRSRARSVRPESLRALMPSHCQFPFSADLVCGTRSPGIPCYALVALAAGANAVYASIYHALASKAEPALSSWRWCSCLSVHHACLWVQTKQLPRLCPIENLLEHPDILECHTPAGGALLVAPCWWRIEASRVPLQLLLFCSNCRRKHWHSSDCHPHHFPEYHSKMSCLVKFSFKDCSTFFRD